MTSKKKVSAKATTPSPTPEVIEKMFDDATAEIRKKLGLMGVKPQPTRAHLNPLSIGNSVFIRTVTHYYTGRIVAITDGEIVLEDAAWVADTQRWSETLKTGVLNEVEPYPDGQVVVFRGACVDLAHWDHPLPRKAHP